MSCEATSLSMRLGLADHLLCAIVNGAKFSEKVTDRHHLVAMGARSAGSKPFAKDAAFVAALLTQRPRVTLGALVDDGRQWESVGKAELELVGWALTETKAALAAGVRAVGLATSSWKVATAHAAHTRLAGSRSIVTQRSFPQAAAVVGAWKHQ
jgi:hypothetical protein